jgi:hypothetical protein
VQQLLKRFTVRTGAEEVLLAQGEGLGGAEVIACAIIVPQRHRILLPHGLAAQLREAVECDRLHILWATQQVYSNVIDSSSTVHEQE